MKKVDSDLLIITPNLESGGAERVAVSVAREAVRRRRRVALLSIYPALGALRGGLDSEVDVIELASGNIFRKIVEMRRFLSGFDGEILSCQRKTNVLVGFVALTLRRTWRKLLFREASTFEAVNNKMLLKRWLYLLLMRLAYLSADKIIANSVATRSDVLRYLGVDGTKVVAIPNPVLTENYKILITEPLHDSFFERDVKVLINIGRLEGVKGQFILLKVLERLINIDRSFRLVLIGSGSLKSTFEAVLVENDLREYVKFIEFSDNVYKYLGRSSLYLFSSLWEGFGNVLVESLACGTPIVGFECHGGAVDVIKSSSEGVLIKERSVDSMVNEIELYFAKGAPRDTVDVSQYRVDSVYDMYFGL